MAALDRTQIAVQERAVTGALENDREAIHQAIKLDPLTGAALTLEEAHEMTEELLEANEKYLPKLE
jgi:alpha-galactosidase